MICTCLAQSWLPSSCIVEPAVKITLAPSKQYLLAASAIRCFSLTLLIWLEKYCPGLVSIASAPLRTLCNLPCSCSLFMSRRAVAGEISSKSIISLVDSIFFSSSNESNCLCLYVSFICNPFVLVFNQ